MDEILIDIFGEDCREFCEVLEETTVVIDVEGKYYYYINNDIPKYCLVVPPNQLYGFIFRIFE